MSATRAKAVIMNRSFWEVLPTTLMLEIFDQNFAKRHQQ